MTKQELINELERSWGHKKVLVLAYFKVSVPTGPPLTRSPKKVVQTLVYEARCGKPDPDLGQLWETRIACWQGGSKMSDLSLSSWWEQ